MIITVSNSKGGVGKSTTSAFMALTCSERGKTLLIDSGYQRCSTEWFLGATKTSLLDMLLKKADAVYKYSDTLDVIPATIELNNFSEFFAAVPDEKKELILYTSLRKIVKQYDFVVIDTESSLNTLTRNALVMANIILIPIYDAPSINEAKKVIAHAGVLRDIFSRFMVPQSIYAVPVMYRWQNRKIRAMCDQLNVPVLEPVKFHKSIFLNDKNKIKKALPDFRRSLGELICKN